MRTLLAALLVAVFGMAFLAASPTPTAVPAPGAAAAMASAAERWLASLSAEQRGEAVFAFDAEERRRWHFIPREAFPRRGLSIKAMSPAQRALAHDLLEAGLSQQGYLTATQVMELEGILGALERGGRFDRDPEEYRFTVFGTPAARGAWGWRFEGHHISLHFTIVEGNAVAAAPAFVGANPAEVREGPRAGLRILAAREDAARALLASLTPEQRTTAVLRDTVPADILTGNRLDLDPFRPAGLRAAALDATQREFLMRLIEVYTSLMTDEVATERMARLREAGLDEISFVWIGSERRGQPHYYRVQGPTFLVEYDNVQNDANHIHSVWRDFDGDFGRDILREHLAAVPH